MVWAWHAEGCDLAVEDGDAMHSSTHRGGRCSARWRIAARSPAARSTPSAFYNAISRRPARIKGIKSPVAGQAQILVLDLEAGTPAKNLTLVYADARDDLRIGADHPHLARGLRPDAPGLPAAAASYRDSLTWAKQPIRADDRVRDDLVVETRQLEHQLQLFTVELPGDRLQRRERLIEGSVSIGLVAKNANGEGSIREHGLARRRRRARGLGQGGKSCE